MNKETIEKNRRDQIWFFKNIDKFINYRQTNKEVREKTQQIANISSERDIITTGVTDIKRAIKANYDEFNAHKFDNRD